MKKLKLHFEFDKNLGKPKYKNFIIKKYNNYSPRQSDIIVVVGGDGFMLQILKKYQKFKKPFYGMNKGTFGFLMNKFRVNHIEKNILKTNQVKISALEMIVTTKSNKKKRAIAINEISLLRQSRQTASLQILSANKILVKKLICDGVLVSTPAGSTAYNLSVHGPILSLNSKKIAVTPISPFRPRRWIGKIVSSLSTIRIKNLNTKKRPVSAVADNVEVRNVKNVKISVNDSLQFKLLYDKKNSLDKKIKLEQLRKQTR